MATSASSPTNILAMRLWTRQDKTVYIIIVYSVGCSLSYTHVILCFMGIVLSEHSMLLLLDSRT